MKLRFQSVVFILILFGVIFASCENPWMEDILDPLLKPTVTFVSNGGSYIEPLKVDRGTKIDAPQDPERSGFNFGGWYTEQQLVNLVDFPYIVTKSVTLFAMWDYVNIDYRISLSITGTHPFASRKTGETPPDAQTITVTNTGLNATGTLNIALSGANASSFTLSRSSLDSIDPESTDIFTIRPNSDLGEGTYTASVRVSGGNGISASFNVSFTVEPSILGISLTAQNLSGGLYTFSNVEVGGSTDAVTVTVTNTGNQPTGELTIELSGANPESFALSPSTLTSLNPGAQNTFTVAPNDGLDVGTYTAVVTVSNGSDIEESFNVSFTVLAGTYGISISASGLTAENAYTFPAGVYQGDVPSALLVTVTNTQGQNTGELSIALTGTNPTSFTLLDGSALASINPGNNGTFRIVPTGSIAGTYSATVTITGANNISASFTVSFTVTPAPIANNPVITVTYPAAGQTRADAVVTITSPTSPNFTVTLNYLDSDNNAVQEDALFIGGETYNVFYSFLTGANHIFPANFTVTINDEEINIGNAAFTAISTMLSFTVTPATGELTEEQMNDADFGPGAVFNVHKPTTANFHSTLITLSAGNHVVYVTGDVNFTSTLQLTTPGVIISLRGDGNPTLTFDGQSIVIYGESTLILRDVTLNMRENGNAISLSGPDGGGTLVMEEGSAITSTFATPNGSSIVGVGNGGSFIMKGGKIHSCNTNSSIVAIWGANAHFEKHLGAIIVGADGSSEANNPRTTDYLVSVGNTVLLFWHKDTTLGADVALSVTVDAAGTGIEAQTGSWETTP